MTDDAAPEPPQETTPPEPPPEPSQAAPEREPSPGDLRRRKAERNRRLGEALRRTRERRRLSVASVAARLAISRRRYAEIEDGTLACEAVELADLWRILGLPLADILAFLAGGPPPTPPKTASWADMLADIDDAEQALAQLFIMAADLHGRSAELHAHLDAATAKSQIRRLLTADPASAESVLQYLTRPRGAAAARPPDDTPPSATP